MSAQTGIARRSDTPDTNPSAPVIVKMGGGEGGVEYGNDTPALNPVIIESQHMAFVEFVPGQFWELSKSTSPGRIHGLKINDGKTHGIEPAEKELASIRVQFGEAQLLLMESGAGKDIVLVIASVGRRFTSSELWNEASATFPTVTGVTFMKGTEVIVDKTFSDPAVTLSVDFQQIVQ